MGGRSLGLYFSDVWVVWVVVESRGNTRFGAEKFRFLVPVCLGLKHK